MTHRPHIVCFQERLTHYRTAFFQKVRDQLEVRDIRFTLVHGAEEAATSNRQDSGSLSWAKVVAARNVYLGPFTGIWIPTPRGVPVADLVVLTQANRLLANYAWLMGRLASPLKVAFWGHGANLQSSRPTGLRERWKRMLVNRVDWWFAYTDLTRDLLLDARFPANRITVLDNAIDNESFCADLRSVADHELIEFRKSIGCDADSIIGLYCGSLYPGKRLDYLLDAADAIRKRMPSFTLVVIGTGPCADEIAKAAKEKPWVRWVGAQTGRRKAAYFRLAHIILNPGALGLHVLDAFWAGRPLITTESALHGPELAYLKHEVNGWIVNGDASHYAEVVFRLMHDEATRSRLGNAARQSAERHTLANMVGKFADGVSNCLSMRKKQFIKLSRTSTHNPYSP